MLPPPAPTECTSTIGNRTGCPFTSRSLATSGRWFSMRHTSVLVPPTSKVMRSGHPARPARKAAPVTPAAGPDMRHRPAIAPASRSEATPPWD